MRASFIGGIYSFVGSGPWQQISLAAKNKFKVIWNFFLDIGDYIMYFENTQWAQGIMCVF